MSQRQSALKEREIKGNRLYRTNETQDDPAIGHSQRNKKKERHARKDKT